MTKGRPILKFLTENYQQEPQLAQQETELLGREQELLGKDRTLLVLSEEVSA